MCLILSKPKEVEVDVEDIKSAVTVNPDGFGMMLPKGNGELEILKSINYTPEKIVELHNEHKDKMFVSHFRFNTRGETSTEMCHPFPILTKKEDGIDVSFVHNGTIPTKDMEVSVKESKKYSDTYLFNEQFLKPLFKKYGPDALKNPLLVKMVEEYIGWSRLLVLDGNGNQFIFNEKKGEDHKGLWVSNKYSFNRRHRTSSHVSQYPTTYGGNRGRWISGKWEDGSYVNGRWVPSTTPVKKPTETAYQRNARINKAKADAQKTRERLNSGKGTNTSIKRTDTPLLPAPANKPKQTKAGETETKKENVVQATPVVKNQVSTANRVTGFRGLPAMPFPVEVKEQLQALRWLNYVEIQTFAEGNPLDVADFLYNLVNSSECHKILKQLVSEGKNDG